MFTPKEEATRTIVYRFESSLDWMQLLRSSDRATRVFCLPRKMFRYRTLRTRKRRRSVAQQLFQQLVFRSYLAPRTSSTIPYAHLSYSTKTITFARCVVSLSLIVIIADLQNIARHFEHASAITWLFHKNLLAMV